MKKHDQTSCTDSSCGTLAKTHSTAVTTAQPHWHAEKTEAGVSIEVTLPGVSKSDLSLEVEGRDLRLTAKRSSVEAERRLLRGRPAPEAYALKLSLGESLDGDSLTASLKDGILTIGVPVASEARPRTISID